jgi:diguanylate cyclase (GGDEF)-like protein
VARVKWRQSLSSQDGAPPRQQACAMLEELFQRLDFDPASARDARQALEQRRTLRKNVLDDLHGTLEESLLLCVPLMADQRLIGVLRIRRQPEGFDGPVAETLEETLIESATHIALAMKKDEDDRKAITDQLTGLFIKRHFLSVLEQSRLQVAEDPGKGFSLVLSDIDHFKKVNDTYGHLSGDLILKQVARVLGAGLRAGDLAFRYGGEEMAILMPEAGVEAAQQIAERVRAAVERAVFLGDRDQKIPTTISMGVASFGPGLTERTLIARADQALYASKHAGRNRVTSWSEELDAPRQVPVLPLPESTLSSGATALV